MDRPAGQNLVLHYRGPNGLALPAPEGWRLIEVYWSDVPGRSPDSVLDADPTHRKTHATTALARAGALGDYARIMLADDDIEPVVPVARIFAEFEASGARMAHPALTRDSYYAHECSRMAAIPRAPYVPVPFTELIAPMFTRAALEEYLPYFDETLYGWGLEQMWACHERAAGRQVVRLDAAPIRHVRPVGQGSAYVQREAALECAAFMGRHRLEYGR